MNGKGSKARPFSIPYSEYANNFDQINWSKKSTKKKSKKQELTDATDWSQMLGELPENYKEEPNSYYKEEPNSSLNNPNIKQD